MGVEIRPPPTIAPDRRWSGAFPVHFDFERAFAVVDEMRPIAEAKGVSMAQVALAWLLAKDAVSSVILGASKPSQLADNLGAADIVLEADEVAALDAITAPKPIYPHDFLDRLADGPTIAALARRPGDTD